MDNTETPKDHYYKLGIFYHYKNNPQLWVPKTDGLGWTLNFANKWSYVVVFVIIALVASAIIGGMVQKN